MSESLTDTGARSNKRRSPASLSCTPHLSVRFFGRKNIFVSSLFQSIAPLQAHIFLLSLLRLTHFPLSHKLSLGQKSVEKKLSPSQTVNISFREHMVYTVKLSCKRYKLSSQNVHVTQFSVVCFHVYVI